MTALLAIMAILTAWSILCVLLTCNQCISVVEKEMLSLLSRVDDLTLRVTVLEELASAPRGMAYKEGML